MRLFKGLKWQIERLEVLKIMKIWKVKKPLVGTVAYVKVADSCKICDTSYAALQMVRDNMHDCNISGTQLLDVEHG